MNEDVRKKLNTYRRELEETKVNTTIYTVIFSITIIVYGFFGIIPLARVLKAKLDTAQELDVLNEQLQTKYNNLLKSQQDMVAAKGYIRELYKAVPKTNEIEDYMVAIANAASKSGFKQTNLVVQDVDEGYSDIRVGFEGSFSQIPSLISSIENLERLTVIREFDYRQHEGIAKLYIVLRVFYLI